MREADYARQTIGQIVIGCSGIVKDAELFVCERIAIDIVAVQDAGMSGQTGQDRGGGLRFRPIENIG